MTAKDNACPQDTSLAGDKDKIDERTARIRALNDGLRCRGEGGRQYVTPGILRFGPFDLMRLRQQIAGFTDFTPDNDPYGEHDFGSVTFNGEVIFWKIDYYDVDLQCGSPEPSDPTVTVRVLTIMLASEY